MTIINEKAYKILENSIVKNAVSHFYIFHGPKNVGKKKLAYLFSKLLKRKLLVVGTHLL